MAKPLPALLTAGVLLLAVAGCDDQERVPFTLSPVEFSSVFMRIDSIVLEQPDDFPLVNPVGMDVSGDGWMVIADAGEAQLRVFTPDGRLERAIGRRGEGPGEFKNPRSPVIDEASRIHVVDPSARRISVFERDGTLIRETPMPEGRVLLDVALTERGYLATSKATAVESNDGVLALIDSLGTVLWERLPLERRYPGGAESPRWRSLSGFHVVSAGDVGLMTATLFDSLWVVGLDGVIDETLPITLAEYETPTLPESDPQGMAELAEWAGSQLRAATVEGDGELVLVPFTRGRYWQDGESGTVAFRDPSGGWSAMLSTPVVFRAKGRRIFTLERPTLETFVIGVYEWRGDQ